MEVRRDFLDPAKHYVRTSGWLPQAKKRAEMVKGKDRRQWLEYFTFPAERAIDVWMLDKAGLIEYDGASFPGVRYCERDTETYIRLKEVLGGTKGWNKPFEELHGLPDFRKSFPYDIFNLDFTSALFSPNPPYVKTLDAIENLFQLQQDRSFDMFLTLKAAPGQDDREAVDQLQQLMLDNLQSHSDVKKTFMEKYGPVPQLRKNDYTRFLVSTVPKLMAGFAASADWDVLSIESYYYSRGKYSIVKFLFSFMRPPHEGAVLVRARRYRRKETAYVDSVRRLITMMPVDVDAMLDGNAEAVAWLEMDVNELLGQG